MGRPGCCCSCPEVVNVQRAAWHRDLARPPAVGPSEISCPLVDDIGPSEVMCNSGECDPVNGPFVFTPLDAIEQLWRDIGDGTYAETETIAEGCAVSNLSSVRSSAKGAPFQQDNGYQCTEAVEFISNIYGRYRNRVIDRTIEHPHSSWHLEFDITPSQPVFTGGQIFWTGVEFDPQAHADHLAMGYLRGGIALKHDGRRGHFRLGQDTLYDDTETFPPFGKISPAYWAAYLLTGVCMRPTAGGETIYLQPRYGLADWTMLPCWATFEFGGHPSGWINLFVMHEGKLVPRTDLHKTANTGTAYGSSSLPSYWDAQDPYDWLALGLNTAPHVPTVTYEIGFYVLATTGSLLKIPDNLEPTELSQVRDEYHVGVRVNNMHCNAEYRCEQEVAFRNKTDLVASCLDYPEGDAYPGPTEPVQLRGMSVPLTLVTSYDEPAPPPIDSRKVDPLTAIKALGYAYEGETDIGSVHIKIYYSPCRELWLQFTSASSACEAWVKIRHTSAHGQSVSDLTRIDYSSAGLVWRTPVEWDDEPWFNHGMATTPSFAAGVPAIELTGPDSEAMTFNEGIRCLETDLGDFDRCYSLQPIAIGYRQRINDHEPPFLSTPCWELPCRDALEFTAQYNRCWFHLLRSMGFSSAIEYTFGSLSGFVSTAYWLWVDITEPPP